MARYVVTLYLDVEVDADDRFGAADAAVGNALRGRYNEEFRQGAYTSPDNAELVEED